METFTEKVIGAIVGFIVIYFFALIVGLNISSPFFIIPYLAFIIFQVLPSKGDKESKEE